MGDGKGNFTVAARAVFNGVVSMHRDKQSCQEVGGLPLPFQSSDDGRLRQHSSSGRWPRRLAGVGSACGGGGLSQLDEFTHPPT